MHAHTNVRTGLRTNTLTYLRHTAFNAHAHTQTPTLPLTPPSASPSIVESNTRTLDRLIVKDTPEPSEPSTWDMLRDMWSKVSVPHGQTHRETPLSPKASERAARPAVSLPV